MVSSRGVSIHEKRIKTETVGVGWPWGPASDKFALGCLIYEMIATGPLFPGCRYGPFYQDDKALLYERVLGKIPGGHRRRLTASCRSLCSPGSWPPTRSSVGFDVNSAYPLTVSRSLVERLYTEYISVSDRG